MNYLIKPIDDKTTWDDFLNKIQPQTMLQTWEWGQHYQNNGSKIWRLGLFSGTNLIANALLIKIEARRGTFLLCPHGPTIEAGSVSQLKPIFEAFTKHCLDLAKAERCAFLRFCTMLENNQANQKLFRNLGYIKAPIHTQIELTSILDITKPEAELLLNMRQTTRYSIRKSEKDGLKVFSSADPEAIEKFWPIYEATAKRQHYTPFKKADIKEEFKLFAEQGKALTYFAEHQGKIVAVSIIIFTKYSAFYHHSGSIDTQNKINSSYLIQWRAIQEAKKRGCKYYNFWGISPDELPKHPWAGLTRFKKGFGGQTEEYLPGQDRPISLKYPLNWAVESIRRRRRGF